MKPTNNTVLGGANPALFPPARPRPAPPPGCAAPPAGGPGQGRLGRRASAAGQEIRFCLWTAALARVNLTLTLFSQLPRTAPALAGRETPSPHSSPHWRLHAAGREGLILIRP